MLAAAANWEKPHPEVPPMTDEEIADAAAAMTRARTLEALRKLRTGGPPDMNRIEDAVEEAVVRIAEDVSQAILDSEPDAAGNRLPCPECAQTARFHSVQVRHLVGFHGPLVLARRRYYCPSGHSICPLDSRLGLDAGSTTPKLRDAIARLAASRGFEAAARDLLLLRGVAVSESTVERASVVVGRQLLDAARLAAEQHETGGQAEPIHRPGVLYVSMDGVYAPLREPWKMDGSAGKLECRWGECKVGMAYEMKKDAKGRDHVLWREYAATFGNIAEFRPMLAALAHRCGAGAAKAVVFLADGLACNWTLAWDYFPEAVHIVDWMHAVEHIKAVEQAFFGPGTNPGGEWFEARKAELWAGKALRVAEAIREIPELPGETVDQANLRRREADYFQNNAERMRYATFRSKGFQIATGVMEASCRTVVNQRFDQSGMHWRQETAECLVALRAALLSSTPPDLRARACWLPRT